MAQDGARSAAGPVWARCRGTFSTSGNRNLQAQTPCTIHEAGFKGLGFGRFSEPSALGGCTKFFHVGQVPYPTGSQLGCDEIVPRDKETFQPGGRVNYALDPAFPGGFEISARNIWEDVEPVRIAAKTKKGAGIGEVFRPNILERGSKFR